VLLWTPIVCNIILETGVTAEILIRISLMADNEPKVSLHLISGELLEVRADEILSVQKQSADGGARIILSRTDKEGHNVQVAVSESAAAITEQLADAESALQWQGA
jgi:hypothetical protein